MTIGRRLENIIIGRLISKEITERTKEEVSGHSEEGHTFVNKIRDDTLLGPFLSILQDLSL